MNKHVILFYLRRYQRTLISYILTISLLTLMYAFFYPYIASDFETIVKQLPKELIQAMKLDQINNFESYFRFFGGLIISIGMMMLGFHLGTTLMNLERKDGMEDYLYTRPITKHHWFGIKLVVGSLLILIGSILMWFMFQIGLMALNLEHGFIVGLVFNVGLLSYASMLIAMLVGSFYATKQVALISLTSALLFYLLQLMVEQGGIWHSLRFISLMDYYNIKDGHIVTMIITTCIIFTFSVGVGMWCLSQLDVKGGRL